MPKATKRERQRQNREARREAMLAEEKRRRRFRTARNLGLILLALLVLLVVLQLTRDDEESDDASGQAAAVTCNDRTPSASDKQQYAAPPEMSIDPTATYEVVMSTSCGDIPITLDAAAAPQTVNSFVFLAREGFYDGTPFHRVIPRFVDQGGSPDGSPNGGPGYQLPDEPPTDGYQAGDVALANSGPGTSGSQFFLVVHEDGARQLNANGSDPYLYNIVGRMSADGLKVAKKINSFGTTSGTPDRELYVFDVTVNGPAPTTTTAAP